MKYSETVMDHFLHPRQVGVLNTSHKNTTVGRVGSLEQGAIIQVHLAMNESGHIEQARFKAYGCACTIAAGSLLVSQLEGLSAEQAQQLAASDWAQPLALPAIKLHCAMLAQEAVESALQFRQSKVK